MITEDRLHHIIGVARKAYKVSKDLGYDEAFCRKCFALGWNHDIGYEFDPVNHAFIGWEILRDFDCNQAIANHSEVPSQINKEWLILCLADMTTSPLGEEVTLDERLSEIESRYGVNHKWYKDAREVCNVLKAHFKDYLESNISSGL